MGDGGSDVALGGVVGGLLSCRLIAEGRRRRAGGANGLARLMLAELGR